MKYHLLMTSPDRFYSILLGSYPTLADATQAQNWMRQFCPGSTIEYPIATFDLNFNVFDVGRLGYRPVQGPYTDEAWARKCAEIGYRP